MDATVQASQPPATRPRANTFDVFDTLIARRCIYPWRIFEQMAARLGPAAFTQARIAAEAQLIGSTYTLDDIYARLAALCGWPPGLAAQIKQLEIETELRNVLPIAENLARLRHGDVLVSDMYLPEPVIRRLLDAAGLDKRVGLVVSNRGKHDGHIWPRIAAAVECGLHLGDNPHSDVAMPRRHGIAAALTAASAPTAIEQLLAQNGLPELALIVREARLRTWHPDPTLRELQCVQIGINLPILLLASLRLFAAARAIGADRLLFSSRDCDLWLELARRLLPRLGIDLECDYFYTSRLARRAPSDDYLGYCRSLITPRTLVVDVCGTGWSLAHLFANLGMPRGAVFLIHRLPPLDAYEHGAPAPPTCTIHTAMTPDQAVKEMLIELVNTAEHGSVLDVRMVAGLPVPVFDPVPASARMQEMVAVQRAAFLAALEVLDGYPPDEALALPPEHVSRLILTLYDCLGRSPAVQESLGSEGLAESKRAFAALGITVGW